MAYCSKCGAKLSEGAALCPSCGTAAGPAPDAGAGPAAPPPVQRTYVPGPGAMAPNLMTRVTNILTKPKEEWPVIAGEPASVSSLFTGYIVILAAIPAIAGFLSSALLGAIFASLLRIPLAASLGGAILTYILSLAGVYLAAVIIEKLAPTFQSQGTTVDALKLVAYSYTALWVAGICGLLPVIGVLGVLAGGIYSIYLFYLGLPVIMKTPQDKVVAYMIAAAIVIIVIYFLITMIVGAITAVLFLGAVRTIM
jgi:hypothetical protein